VGYGHHWQAGSDRRENGASALGSASYELFPGTRLKASVSRNIRFPTLRDLYAPSEGNPDLAAERAYTYQGGVEQRLPWNTVASATGFYTVAKNLIQKDQVLSRSENLAEIRFAGFEVTGSTSPVERLLLRGSYTYLESKDRAREGRQEQQYTPRHKVALEAKYELAFGLSPYVSLSWTGDQYYYTKNSVTPVRKGRLGDIVLVDVKLSQWLLRDRLSVYAGATNLLDWNYESSYGLPQPGRFVYGGLECRRSLRPGSRLVSARRRGSRSRPCGPRARGRRSRRAGRGATGSGARRRSLGREPCRSAPRAAARSPAP
jgi:outer membrane cobalamin receptor